MIKCSKCKQEKEPEDFFKAKTKTGRQGYCKECAKEYRKAYYKKNKPLMKLNWDNMMKDPEKYKRVRRQQREANRRWIEKQKT